MDSVCHDAISDHAKIIINIANAVFNIMKFELDLGPT